MRLHSPQPIRRASILLACALEGRVVGHAIGVVSKQQLAQGALAAKRGRLLGTLSAGASWPQR